jgi:hypothetical protein
MCVHLASYPFLIGEYLSVTMPLCLYLFVLLLLFLAFSFFSPSFPTTRSSSFPSFPLRSLASPFVPPSFPLRSLASQVPAGCVGGGSRCPLSSAIRAEWCVRVSSIDDGIDGVDDNRFDNRFDNRGDGGDGGDGGKEEGGY